MKIRHDFVTNSSSSSFIISTEQEIHPDIKNFCTLITNENLLEVLTNDIWEDDYQQLKECGNFTNEQIKLIDLFHEGNLNSYLDVKDELNQGKTLYEISYDWSAPHYNSELNKFLTERKFDRIASLD